MAGRRIQINFQHDDQLNHMNDQMVIVSARGDGQNELKNHISKSGLTLEDKANKNLEATINSNGSSWSTLELDGQTPPPRYGHSFLELDASNILLFGGDLYGNDVGNPGNTFYNDIHLLDIENWTWVKKETTGEIPSKRAGHAMVKVGNNVYMMGGLADTTAVFEFCPSLLYCLNLSTMVWSTCELEGAAPPPRAWHSATTVGNKIWIFGGRSDVFSYRNDVYVADLVTKKWELMETKGDAPAIRAGHFASLVPNSNKIIIYGGRAQVQKGNNNRTCEFRHYSDVHVLDTDTLTWTKLDVKDSIIPRGRAGHWGCMIKDNLLMIGAGYENKPPKKSVILSDVFLFNLDTQVWRQVEIPNTPPGTLCSKAVYINDHIYMFGGEMSHLKYHTSVSVLNTFEIGKLPYTNSLYHSSKFADLLLQVDQFGLLTARPWSTPYGYNTRIQSNQKLVHKHILQIRCPHLFEVLQSNVAVNISAMSLTHLDLFLEYIYNGNMALDNGKTKVSDIMSVLKNCINFFPITSLNPMDVSNNRRFHFAHTCFQLIAEKVLQCEGLIIRAMAKGNSPFVPRNRGPAPAPLQLKEHTKSLNYEDIVNILACILPPSNNSTLEEYNLGNLPVILARVLNVCGKVENLIADLKRDLPNYAIFLDAIHGLCKHEAQLAEKEKVPYKNIETDITAMEAEEEADENEPAPENDHYSEWTQNITKFKQSRKTPKGKTVLEKDLETLFLSREQTYDYIISVDNSYIPCHKFIICSRIPFFAAALRDNSFVEAQKGILHLSGGITAHAMQSLLAYVYSNDLSSLENNVDDCLYILATSGFFGISNSHNDKFNYEPLLKFCRDTIMKYLTEQNCIALLENIKLVDDILLVKKVSQWISTRLEKITKQPAFHSVSHMLQKLVSP